MSNINDNNLDDLLRRAAEKYPLRTDSADWGKLVSDLEKDPSLILPPVGEDRRRRRRFFWLFLLLPLAGVGYYAWHAAGRSVSPADQTRIVAGKDGEAPAANARGGHVEEKGQTNAQPEQGGHDGGEKGAVQGQGGLAGVPGQSGQGSATGQTRQPNVARQNGQVDVTVQDGPKAVTAGNKGPAQVGGQNGQKSAAGQDGQTSIPGQGGRASVSGQDDLVRVSGQKGRAGISRQNGEVSLPQGDQVSGHRTSDQTGVGSVKDRQAQLSETAKEGGGHVGRADETAGRENVAGGQNESRLHLASNNMQRVNTKTRRDVAAGDIPVKSNAKKDNIKLQKAKPSFYVGILGSPDLSTIKWQSVKNVGTRFGLLLGYSFNSRWSIESGAYYSRKNYYTDGEYFDKTNAYILKYVDQLKVNGVCNMWEFPINVRYNLSTGPKMKWFATAGVSAYYMSKEKYDCSGNLNGAPWSEEWNKKPSHNSWSSNLNLSVGYEQRLGRIGNLRLEPYVRVPMTGIGTGKLSIMSAGLNIGITRRIW